MKNKLLLHCCCAPCAGGCVGHPVLAERELLPELLYFSNSNLDSAEEFERRLAEHMELKYPDFAEKIHSTGKMDDSMENQLQTALKALLADYEVAV